MADCYTTRTFSAQGGGARGVLSLYYLKKFYSTIGVPFDTYCGTSVGSIIALGLAFGLSVDQLISFFHINAPYIFSMSSLVASWRPGLITKLALIATNTPFYQSSGVTAESYGAGLLKKALEDVFDTATLKDLNANVIIPSYRYDTSSYVLFSNIDHPSFIGQNEKISNVILCSSAAPIYLPSVTLDDTHEYIDGGIYMNNPALFGNILSKMNNKVANRHCILSLGTGIGEMGFDPNEEDPPAPPELQLYLDSVVNKKVYKDIKNKVKQFNYLKKELNVSGTLNQQKIKLKKEILKSNSKELKAIFDSVQTIFSLFDIACTGGQESISKCLDLESNYTLSNMYSYTFQPNLDLTKDTELDNTSSDIFIDYYNSVADDYYNNDLLKLNNFIGHLNA